MKSYFFNAEPTTDTVNHPTGYDREYDADAHAAFFAPFFATAGVMAGTDADACLVEVENNNTLRVHAGCAYVRGRMVQFDGTETITITEDCIIVARMNKTADVRDFQLMAVQELVQAEDIYDLELAQATVVPVAGGYEAVVIDKRTFLAFAGQPPYYPPSADNLPYVLWLYTLGFPMTEEQRTALENTPDLMTLFHASLGAMRSASVVFTAEEWQGAGTIRTLTIPRTAHKRQSGQFGYTLRHLTGSGTSQTLSGNTWAVKCTDIAYNEATGDIVLTSEDAYPGQIEFFA